MEILYEQMERGEFEDEAAEGRWQVNMRAAWVGGTGSLAVSPS